ncbi:two pore domain potassium channel family protein [Candidatus Chloroploca sp. M-50]|uniref:Two pore domain potassium channel family protein n=1 Tax=Candidatus Chloroploca mongolica TaxID=2528176 RepID=A0ABS4DHC6_9CHLR|nr:potassium channel family protein [Candidatus Chloroploca mongolica]MBP1468844.1 two pore domain potassium channel family protein [Candidatus Chloroploca mongolica]
MVALLITLAQFWSTVRMVWRDPSFRSLAALTVLLLFVGTLMFHEVEGWAYLDSFYFSAITLATVGYGDFTPKTPVGKLLTVFYIFMGFGMLMALLTRFAEALLQSEQEARTRRHLRRMQARQKEASRKGKQASRKGERTLAPSLSEEAQAIPEEQST